MDQNKTNENTLIEPARNPRKKRTLEERILEAEQKREAADLELKELQKKQKAELKKLHAKKDKVVGDVLRKEVPGFEAYSDTDLKKLALLFASKLKSGDQ
ncbi:hypothetical protein [Enterococcus sp. BWR-S5]|uniref:hypothetical protein n=1 Tax=Enterococcus sp. BWR-S5 TaxID=2787714 RepID=UPI001921F491|nr:hypothetical protein [Enterococcus sp. BWR-S5]MBL1227226.1 hypothetical protein [Enterococcus sp. BWR-S5]